MRAVRRATSEMFSQGRFLGLLENYLHLGAEAMVKAIGVRTLDIREVGRVLGCSAATVRRRWQDGYLCPPRKFGPRAVRWLESDLVEWSKNLRKAMVDDLEAGRRGVRPEPSKAA